jgi:hypothetical protein
VTYPFGKPTTREEALVAKRHMIALVRMFLDDQTISDDVIWATWGEMVKDRPTSAFDVTRALNMGRLKMDEVAQELGRELRQVLIDRGLDPDDPPPGPPPHMPRVMEEYKRRGGTGTNEAEIVAEIIKATRGDQ